MSTPPLGPNPLDPNQTTPNQTTPNPFPQAPAAGSSATGGSRRLSRSRSDRMLGGVCGGLAQYFGIDATLVRIAFVVSVILPGPQVLLYLLLWLVIPQD